MTSEGERFEARKSSVVQRLRTGTGDRSPKGSVDDAIVELVAQLNEHADYYTTSSCAGRITLFLLPTASLHTSAVDTEDSSAQLTSGVHVEVPVESGSNASAEHHLNSSNSTCGFETAEKHEAQAGGSACSAGRKKGRGGGWLLSCHREVSREELTCALYATCAPCGGSGESSCVRAADEAVREQEFVVSFKHEPFIMHVECRSLAAAQRLLQLADGSGFRESGMRVGKRIMVAIRTTSLRIDAPVARNGRCLVSDEYLSFLSDLANEKFRLNLKLVQRLQLNAAKLSK